MSDDRRGPFPDEQDETGSVTGAHSGSEDRDAPEELELGEALGRALREQPETAWTTPPVSLISERAAARARARAARRTVAGVAAAAALIIGGVAVWNGLGDDGTGTVVVSPDDPDATDPDGADLDTAAADGTGTSVASSGEADGPVTGAAAENPSMLSDPPAVEDDQPVRPGEPTPEELSTGPVLQWTEIDPGFVDLYGLESVGDGRVLARRWRGPAAAEQVVVTNNGVDWVDVPMPVGIVPQLVDISGDRWVVTGEGRALDASGEASPVAAGLGVPAGLGRAFFSDDEGATWTELVLNLPPGPARASPNVVEDSRVAAALVSGDNIVLVVVRDTGVDLSAPLEGRDLVPEGKSVVGWSTTGLESIVFDLAEGLPPGESYLPRLIASGAGGGGIGGPGWGPRVGSISLTYDELGLTDEERAVLDDPGYGRVLVLAGDGSAAEAVAEYEGWPGSGYATADGFVLRVTGPKGAVVTSPDGRLWNEQPSSEFGGFSAWAAVAGGTIWDATTDHLGTLRALTIWRGRFGEAAMPVATFEGLQSAGLAVGPAGIVATAHLAPDDAGSEAIVLPEGRIAKDGYELRYNEPEGGVTLWDLEAGAAVYVFGPEDRQVDQPPEGVRESSDDGQFAIVFEDPETGADLVTFTYEELAPVFEATPHSDSATVSAYPEEYEMPETWVGWSADGSVWGWQTMADAFGVDHASVWAQLAVGGDFVIARVDVAVAQIVDVTPIEEVEAGTDAQGDYAYATSQYGVEAQYVVESQERWFIARVP